MIQVEFDDWKITVYKLEPASEEQAEALGVPHMTMTPEYVIPLEPIKDIFPKMTTVDKMKFILISMQMIDENRKKVNVSEGEKTDKMIE